MINVYTCGKAIVCEGFTSENQKLAN